MDRHANEHGIFQTVLGTENLFYMQVILFYQYSDCRVSSYKGILATILLQRTPDSGMNL